MSTFQLRLQPNLSRSICEKCDVLLQDFINFHHLALEIQTQIESFEKALNPQVVLEQCNAQPLISFEKTGQEKLELFSSVKAEPLDKDFLTRSPLGITERNDRETFDQSEVKNDQSVMKTVKSQRSKKKREKEVCFHCGKLFSSSNFRKHVSFLRIHSFLLSNIFFCSFAVATCKK
jgi:hypothetical protein